MTFIGHAPAFEDGLVNVVKEMREALKQYEHLHDVDFEIRVTGPIHHGDLKVAFAIREGYDTYTTSHSLNNMLSEFIRRKGWDVENKPLMIGYVEEPDKTEVYDSATKAASEF